MINTVDTHNAKPFLKWAGGKQQLLEQYSQYFPAKVNVYFEPFLGGGAVFFHLWNIGRINGKVFLFDNNEELINVYTVVRDKAEELIKNLLVHKENHNKTYYYQIRELDRNNSHLAAVDRAARTLYLNKTCYNGLYRVNSRGHFNVPIGSYKNPQIVYPENLRAASKALQGKVLDVQDYKTILELARSGDFVYFDPPYDPVSKTANFTSYTAGNFGIKDQEELAQVFLELSSRGCLCMLSNSSTTLISKLYKAWDPLPIIANRAINSDANGRVGSKEVLVINYDPRSSTVITKPKYLY